MDDDGASEVPAKADPTTVDEGNGGGDDFLVIVRDVIECPHEI